MQDRGAGLVRAELVEVGEDFGVGGALAGGHHPHDVPIGGAEAEWLAQLGVGEAFDERFADQHDPYAHPTQPQQVIPLPYPRFAHQDRLVVHQVRQPQRIPQVHLHRR